MPRGKSRVILAIFVVSLPVVGCSGDQDESSWKQKTSDADAAAAAKVVESLKPNSPEGFDPAALAAVGDPAAILPTGTTLSVDRTTWTVKGDQATYDATVEVPGQDPQRVWVFLREVDGEWLVYATMPLELAEEAP